MRRITSSLLFAGLAALPALSQSHLNVAPGKFVQVTFNHKAGDPANVFSNMAQISNDGTFGKQLIQARHRRRTALKKIRYPTECD